MGVYEVGSKYKSHLGNYRRRCVATVAQGNKVDFPKPAKDFNEKVDRAHTKLLEVGSKAESKINELSEKMDAKLQSTGFYAKIDSLIGGNRGQNRDAAQ
jgi:hypothetical protein